MIAIMWQEYRDRVISINTQAVTNLWWDMIHHASPIVSISAVPYVRYNHNALIFITIKYIMY